MRTAMFCLTENICSKCIGESPYKLGTKHIGMVAAQMSSDTLNWSMKKFHDTTIKEFDIDLNKLFI